MPWLCRLPHKDIKGAEPSKWYINTHLPGSLRRKRCVESLFIILPWNSSNKVRKGKGNRREKKELRLCTETKATSWLFHYWLHDLATDPKFSGPQGPRGKKEHMWEVNPHSLLLPSLSGGPELAGASLRTWVGSHLDRHPSYTCPSSLISFTQDCFD